MALPVELTSVRKHYGSVEALKGIDIAIGPGELVAILGPNGAGKTTAISIMLGLRRATSGEARIFGMAPSDRRSRSRCGVMLQESGVSDVLTVAETVALFRTYYPQPMAVAQALAMAGLQEQAGVRVEKLSGGQRQRLFYALAVCGDPEVLFLDEPTVGMDVESRRAFIEGIRSFHRQGRTIVLTTHYLEEADELASRVIVISAGLVIADASPAEIKSRVQGRRVSFKLDRPLAQPLLDGLEVSRLVIDGLSVNCYSNSPEAILERLIRDDYRVSDLTVVGADLEEAFVSLTAGAGVVAANV